MKKGIRLYWILFFAGCLALVGLSMYEQQQIKNVDKQLQQGYEKTQRIIRAKELGFVELIQNELVMDSSNLQRNWSNLTKLLKKAQCNLFITQNDTLKYWSDNEINYKQIKFKISDDISFNKCFVIHHVDRDGKRFNKNYQDFRV